MNEKILRMQLKTYIMLPTAVKTHFSRISSYLLRSYSCLDELRKADIQKKNNVRFQEYTPLGKSVHGGQARISVPYMIFKVMSYNILSHTHMLTHIRNYRKCPRECLDWNIRRALLSDEFDAENADIFCLQEVDENHKIDILKPFIKKGFDAIYVPRGEDRPDGCALVYRTSMFQVEDLSAIHYKRPEVPLMDRPNVGIVARLAFRTHPAHSVVVANTHFLYNPNREDIKLGQLQMLLTEVERLAYNPKGYPQRYHPVVLTGDLNVRPGSSIIRLINQKFLNKQSEKEVAPAELLKKHLNISESCQYLDVLEARKRGLQDPRMTKDVQTILQQLRIDSDLNSASEADLVSPNGTVSTTEPCKVGVEESEQGIEKNRFPPGCINHVFPFANVYYNSLLDYNYSRKVANPQERKLIVNDYIFYSSDRKRSLTAGQLQLLSRLRLPTFSEYRSQFPFLPNYASGSDHLPLTASFLLPV